MIFDFQYILWVLVPGMILSGFAAWRTRSAFNKFSKVRTQRGITGAQAAQLLQIDRSTLYKKIKDYDIDV